MAKKKKAQLKEVFTEEMEKNKGGKTSQFFVLGDTLKGTTSAVIRCETFSQAHWIYTHHILIPAKRTADKKYQPKRLKKNVYWDGNIYIEKLKLYKKVEGFPVAAIGIRINLKLEV